MTHGRRWTSASDRRAHAWFPVDASIAIPAQPCQARTMTTTPTPMTDKARKQLVCEVALGHLLTPAFAADMVRVAPEDILEVTVTRPADLERQIRVKTRHAGTHYYTVKLTENV